MWDYCEFFIVPFCVTRNSLHVNSAVNLSTLLLTPRSKVRRSKASGYLVPLSGGIDSCATATIVYSMCRLVVQAIKDGNKEAIADAKRIAAFSEKLPDTPEEFCNQIFHTVYMGMANQSSKETRQRAEDLAKRIGSHHSDVNIDDTFHATKNLLTQGTGFEPKFKVHGGSVTENCMCFSPLGYRGCPVW